MYDDILYPTDGSEASKATFPYVVSQAQAFGARASTILYVVNTTYAGVGAAGKTSVNSLRKRSEAVLDEFKQRLREGVDAITRTREGDPYTEIKAYSDDEVDMIVIGTRGRGGIGKYLLGSVTEKVVRTADVPVFTIRSPASEGTGAT